MGHFSIYPIVLLTILGSHQGIFYFFLLISDHFKALHLKPSYREVTLYVMQAFIQMNLELKTSCSLESLLVNTK